MVVEWESMVSTAGVTNGTERQISTPYLGSGSDRHQRDGDVYRLAQINV